jgi:pyridoxine/pyridoxamine 5'-phosphate oxidase
MPEPDADARRIIDANVYMTLATADADGRPWASPVWFAHDDHTRFVWVSRPARRHSQNIAEHPEVGIVIFDSTAPQGAAEAVYADAVAEQVADEDEERWVEIFSRRSEALGWPALTIDDVRAPAALRLYLATVAELFVLGPNDDRIPVDLG